MKQQLTNQLAQLAVTHYIQTSELKTTTKQIEELRVAIGVLERQEQEETKRLADEEAKRIAAEKDEDPEGGEE